MLPRTLFLLASTLVLSAEAPAQLLARVFADGMVLQRDQPITLWGKARPEETVRVTIAETLDKSDFEALIEVTEADAEGKWQAVLPAMEASAIPKVIMVETINERVSRGNVLVGEVWLCSGQSNMEWAVSADTEWALERECFDYPQVRYCRVFDRSEEPLDDFAKKSTWTQLTPSNVAGLNHASGFAYYFGVRLHRYLKVPVGVMHNAIGGTLAEQWTSRSALESMPELKTFLANQPSSDCYNAMIAPISRLGLRGAMFFQGENNSIGKWGIYRHTFPRLIENWRETFGQPEMPFGIVSLYGFGPHTDDTEPELANLPPGLFWYAAIRDVHFRTARSTPNTGLIVTTDLGDTAYIHPARKREVAQRAARWALANVYNEPILHTGPVFESATVEGNKMLVRFEMDPACENVVNRKEGESIWWLDYPISREGKELRGFIVAGEDRVFRPARAKRAKEAGVLEVWSDFVPEPVAVRYAWDGYPDANAIGHDFLPVHPFRSDDWPLVADAPFEEEAKKAWDEEIAALRKEAEREVWTRKLAEMRALLDELQRDASGFVPEAERDGWTAKNEQTRKMIEELEGALRR